MQRQVRSNKSRGAELLAMRLIRERILTNFHLLWFAALGFVVLGPLVRPGYLLLLDAPAGPDFEWPSFMPTPSEGQVAQAAPALAVYRLLGLIHPQLPNKLVIWLIVFLGGVGLFRFLVGEARIHRAAALGGATLFVVNPYVYDRLLAGQILLLLGYALLPWMLSSLTRLAQEGKFRDLVVAIGWGVAVTLADIHIGGMSLLLLMAAIAFSPAAIKTKAAFVGAAVAVLLLVNLYWIIPSWLAGEAGRLGTGDFIAYSPRPRSPGILRHVLVLHGFWRLEFPSPIASAPTRFLWTWIPIACVTIFGLMRAAGSTKWVRPVAAIGSVSLIATILGMGRSFALTAPIAEWLFNNFPGYGIYREPQKWIAVLALAYGIFFAVGLDRLARLLDKARSKAGAIIAASVALPLIATSLLWGIGGRASVSQFPEGWDRANDVTAEASGNLLVFPWYLYQPLEFAGFRVILNPADQVFEMPTLVSSDADLFVRGETQPPDPRDLYVTRLLRRKQQLDNFGHLVAPLGVRYIALAHESDFKGYSFLNRQEDLEIVFSEDEMTLYENLAFVGTEYGLEEEIGGDALSDVLGSPEEQLGASTRLTALEAAALNKPLTGLGWSRSLPGWESIDPASSPVTGTDRSCLDGWRLGDATSVCHLGALAAFPTQDGVEPLWRAGVVVQLASLVISIAAGCLLIAVIWRQRAGEHEKTPRTEWGSSPTSDGR
jgi:hypothetical protein